MSGGGDVDGEVTFSMVAAARRRIARYVRRTPLVRNATLSEQLGTNVYLKMEVFQRTGAFKVRGAFNKILSLDRDNIAGVVAVSGGNHAQGVAYAAQLLQIPCVIILPEFTPANYVAATRGYGAEVIFVPNMTEGFGQAVTFEQRGYTFIHPYGDPLVIAGQGTLGMEIWEDLPQVSAVFASIGGGGMISGTAIALKAHNSAIRIFGVETLGADSMSQALEAGVPVTLSKMNSRARTLGALCVSPLALQIVQQLVEEIVVVSDDDAADAGLFLLQRAKVLTELAASCTLAAARRRKHCFTSNDHVVLILCGGNAELADLLPTELMQPRYEETSRAGLALKVIRC